jgi:hypothetical protein
MSAVNIVNGLLAELSGQLRSEPGQELLLDEDGYLSLDFAGRLSLTLFCPANAEQLVLYSNLLSLPPRNDAAESFLRELLHQNMPGRLHTGERLALEGEKVYLILEKNVDEQANRLSATELHNILLSFAEDADTLALALREYAAKLVDLPASSAPDPFKGAGTPYGQPFLIRA